MVGIQRCCFEFILSLLNLEISIVLGDDIQLTDHLIVIDKSLGIDVQGIYMPAILTFSYTFLELSLAICSPRICQT